MKLFPVFVCFAVYLLSCSQRPFSIEEQGGTRMVLELDLRWFLKQKARVKTNSEFNRLLDELWSKRENQSDSLFVQQFCHLCSTTFPGKNLADFFTGIQSKDNKQIPLALYKEYSVYIDHAKVILATRLDKFGVDGNKLNLFRNQNQLVLELASNYDVKRLRHVVLAGGHLEFREVYDNQNAYTCLENMHTQWLLENGVDSVDTTAQTKGIWQWLQPAVQFNGHNKQLYFMEKGCIAFVLPQDTINVNRYLGNPLYSKLIPSDLHFKWSLKTYDDERNPDIKRLKLFAIKRNKGFDNKTGAAQITNASAHNDASANPSIDFTFDSYGSKLWTDMTGQNINKAIAIVFDGSVVCAPTVHQAITGGTSTISGRFTKEEAIDIAAILSSASLDTPIRIQDEQHINKKN